jgi:hypothetical protein
MTAPAFAQEPLKANEELLIYDVREVSRVGRRFAIQDTVDIQKDNFHIRVVPFSLV